MSGEEGADELYGGRGGDGLVGEEAGQISGRGADVIHGDGGSDSLQGDYGADTLYGGPGDDVLIVDGGETPDRLYCGPGFDRYDVRARAAGEDSGDVFVAADCEREVDFYTITSTPSIRTAIRLRAWQPVGSCTDVAVGR